MNIMTTHPERPRRHPQRKCAIHSLVKRNHDNTEDRNHRKSQRSLPSSSSHEVINDQYAALHKPQTIVGVTAGRVSPGMTARLKQRECEPDRRICVLIGVHCSAIPTPMSLTVGVRPYRPGATPNLASSEVVV